MWPNVETAIAHSIDFDRIATFNFVIFIITKHNSNGIGIIHTHELAHTTNKWVPVI